MEKSRTLEGNSQATGDRDSTGQRAPTTLTQIHCTLHAVIETGKGKKQQEGPGSKSQPGLGKSLYVRGSGIERVPPITAYPRDVPTHTISELGLVTNQSAPWGSSRHSFGPSFRMRDWGSFSLSYKRGKIYRDRGRTADRHGGGGPVSEESKEGSDLARQRKEGSRAV